MFDATAGAQRRRLVRAALSIERVCRYAGRVLCPGVPFPESLFVASESGRAGRDRLRRIPGGRRQAREIGTHAIRAGMLPTERILEDRKRTLDERPRSRKVALALKHEGKIAEAAGRGMAQGPDEAECPPAMTMGRISKRVRQR